MRLVSILSALLVLVACSGEESAPVASSPAQDAGSTPGTDDPPAGDAGAPDAALPAAEAIVAPDDQWSWVDFPASRCGGGTPTGIAVNPHAGATELVVYLQGGGSCASGASCWGPSPTAANMAGFGATEFATTQQLNYPILKRDLAANPMRAMHMVFVPYCTGDLHGGTGEADLAVGDGTTKHTYFWGGADLDLFLERLVPTFPGVKRIILAGTSAGGFGTYVGYDRFARAFAGVRIDAIDDSGPPIPGAGGREGTAPVWKMGMPPDCPTCASLRDLYDAARRKQPASRYAHLTYDRDGTIAAAFGYTPAQYPQVIDTFVASIAADPNAKMMLVQLPAGTVSHVVQSAPRNAVDYLPWMTRMLADDPAWASVTIAP